MTAWAFLVAAGLFEVGFTTAMRYLDGWKPLPLLVFLACIITSFWCLEQAARTIPLGTAYAVWTGIGAFGTALVGMALYGEPATPMRILFLAILIGAVIGLKWVG